MVNVLKQPFESTMVYDLFYCGEAIPNLNQSSLLPKVSRIIRNYIEKLPKKNDKKMIQKQNIGWRRQNSIIEYKFYIYSF